MYKNNNKEKVVAKNKENVDNKLITNYHCIIVQNNN